MIGDSEKPFNYCELKVEKNGSNLSDGQKKIVNLIRMLLANNEIICFDEVNSNFDPETGKFEYFTKTLHIFV